MKVFLWKAEFDICGWSYNPQTSKLALVLGSALIVICTKRIKIHNVISSILARCVYIYIYIYRVRLRYNIYVLFLRFSS